MAVLLEPQSSFRIALGKAIGVLLQQNIGVIIKHANQLAFLQITRFLLHRIKSDTIDFPNSILHTHFDEPSGV